MRVFALVCLLFPWYTVAQTVSWKLIADGEHVEWTAQATWPADSVHAAALDALSSLQGEGHLLARIDSVVAGAVDATLYATRGPVVTIASVALEGVTRADSVVLRRILESRPGQRFSASRVDGDALRLVKTYTDDGYHLVRVTVGELSISHQHPPKVSLTFQIHEGDRLPLQMVTLPGASRTRPGFVRQLAQLRRGAPVLDFDAAATKMRVQDTDIFESVGVPELVVDADSLLIVQIPVVEAPPGAFDLALGYERTDAGGPALIGSGHLAIRNLFGYGRVLALTLNRAPGQLSKVSVRALDPLITGLPISLAAEFYGLQQDSTYGKRDYRIELGYRFEGLLRLFATVTREVTQPGLTGLRITQGQQRIPFATALYAGLGIHLRSLDSQVNPLHGFLVHTEVENGAKLRTLRIVREDTTEHVTRNRQSRLRARARLFIPTFRRQALVVGGETLLLSSREIDESDLFRFGGANSLRGYDEDRFRVPFAVRVLVEYRYLLDAASHALAFFDVGYIDAWHAAEPFRGLYPGFGVGFQIDTAAGIINITAASSTEAPSEIRAHMSISLGL